MKLFKSGQPFQSEEDRVRDARLSYIANRHKPGYSAGPADESDSESRRGRVSDD